MTDAAVIADALATLRQVGAPPRLQRHGALVAEAAVAIADELAGLGIAFDRGWVLAGAVLHDAGKALHPEELVGPGGHHEPAGERLLLDAGVAAHIAGCCRSHAAWQADGLALEELAVALADKLWKGARVADLELRVVDRVAAALGVDRWAVFDRVDAACEAIAADGPTRIARQGA